MASTRLLERPQLQLIDGASLTTGNAPEYTEETYKKQNIQKKHIKTTRTRLDTAAKKVAKGMEDCRISPLPLLQGSNMDILYHFSSAGWIHMG